MISAPINNMYMQKYSHIRSNIIVVRLPYMEFPRFTKSIYIEYRYENKSHPAVVNIAPGSSYLTFVFRFGTYT